MTPGEREGAGRLRRHPSQPRRKVTGDLLLELRHGHALQLTDPRRGVVPDQRGPVVEQRQEGAWAAGSKLLPGAVAGIVGAFDADQHTGLLILPGVHADAGHLPHLGVSAVGADNQPGVDRLPLAQMQRRLRLAALHRFQFATDAQGNRLMRRQRLPQARIAEPCSRPYSPAPAA